MQISKFWNKKSQSENQPKHTIDHNEWGDWLERRYQGENPIKTLLYLHKGDVDKLVLSVLVFIIKHSGVWAMPIITASIIDVVAHPEMHSINDLWVYAGILAIIFAQNIPTHYLWVRFLSTATRNMEINLRAALARRLQHLSMDFYYKSTTGALQAKLLRDVEAIEQLTKDLFMNIPAAAITMLVAIVVTAIRAPIFLVFFLLTVPISVFVVYTLRKPLEQRNRVFRTEVEDMSSRLIEMIQMLPITRAHAVEKNQLEQLVEKLDTVRQAGMKLDAINAIFGASTWVVLRLFDSLCLVVAGYVAYKQIIPLSVGDVILMTGFFSNLTNAVMSFTNILPQVAKGFESIRSVGEILECPDLEHNEGKAAIDNVQGKFLFESVSFAYPDMHQHSLDNLSLEVNPGETIAIVGSSGAGKSTLLNLIIGFLRPTSGRILLDGRDINDLDLRTYRRYLSVVSQDTVLFKGTVRDNILYGMKNVDEKTLQEAIENANAKEFIDKMPEGVNTLLGQNGTRLSGGQRQRIAIARALIRDPRVLILDEATSALDTASEVVIQEALERLMKGRTTFIVAHRLSTIRNADRIVVLDNGHIVEMGSHEKLMAKKGAYAHLRQIAELAAS